jgi:hypothetical protein
MGQCDSCQCTRRCRKPGGTVRRPLDQPIRPFPQAFRVVTNLGIQIGRDPLHDAHSHQEIRAPFKKRCHVHVTDGLLAQRNSRLGNRTDLHDIGQSRRA